LPIGLASIASFLRKEGYNDIELIDIYMKRMNWEQIL
jgi:hypothetical protein